MDALSSLSISKPFCLPLSTQQQRTCHHVRFGVSCRATTTTQANLYKVLCLSPESATKDDIKRAYRSMALQYHPDVCHDPESTRMFVEVNAAYETLSNPMLRAQYDNELGLMRRKMSEEDDERYYWRSGLQKEVPVELKKRSRRRMGQKGCSSGTRMKDRN
ncbi:hypothetical protein RJT34_04128 [Clitoria ternatea]|uniref:J domain-containing protein n=1 Tax=Clitoria ternatea TaxID=43366 RepID=A0AAN9KL18_CLITE